MDGKIAVERGKVTLIVGPGWSGEGLLVSSPEPRRSRGSGSFAMRTGSLAMGGALGDDGLLLSCYCVLGRAGSSTHTQGPS